MEFELFSVNMSFNETTMNETCSISYQPPSMHTSLIVIFLVLYVAVILIGIGGNVFVFYTIYNLKQKSVTHFFMASLASSDFWMATVCIPFTVLSNLVFHYWPFGSALCPIVGFVQVTSVLQRAFTLITITMDQHQVVWHPLRKRLNKKKARILICFLWILAISASVPVLIYARIIKFPANGGNDGVCMEDWETPEERYIYSVTVMVLQYFLPLAIMICCYTHIGVIVWLTKIPGEIIHRQDKRQNRSKRKTLQMLTVVATVYALSWLPLHAMTLIGDSYPAVYDLPHIDLLWMSFHWLAFSNTAMNPIIYCRSNSVFRNSLKLCFNRFKKGNKDNFELILSDRRMSNCNAQSVSMRI